MHNFTPTDVGFFGVKISKMGNFFYFARVYTCWCGCSRYS